MTVVGLVFVHAFYAQTFCSFSLIMCISLCMALCMAFGIWHLPSFLPFPHSFLPSPSKIFQIPIGCADMWHGLEVAFNFCAHISLPCAAWHAFAFWDRFVVYHALSVPCPLPACCHACACCLVPLHLPCRLPFLCPFLAFTPPALLPLPLLCQAWCVFHVLLHACLCMCHVPVCLLLPTLPHPSPALQLFGTVAFDNKTGMRLRQALALSLSSSIYLIPPLLLPIETRQREAGAQRALHRCGVRVRRGMRVCVRGAAACTLARFLWRWRRVTRAAAHRLRAA